MRFMGLEKKEVFKIIFALALLFLFASNYAWFNPRPGFVPAYRISEAVPLFWQYNTDSRLFLEAVLKYPHYWGALNQDIERAMMPTLVKLFSVIVHPMMKRLNIDTTDEMLQLGEAALGWYLLTYFFLFLYAIFFYKLLRDYLKLDKNAAFMAITFSLTANWTIHLAHTFHTFFAELVTPLLVTILFLDACKYYRPWKLIVYSFTGGLLLLIKPVYSIFAAIYLFLLWKREYKKIIFSVPILLIPLGIWAAVLGSIGFNPIWAFPFANENLVFYHSLASMMKAAEGSGVIVVIEYFIEGINLFLSTLINHYSFWLFLAYYQFVVFYKSGKICRDHAIFIIMLLSFVFLQAFAAINLNATRMVTDLSFIIFGLGIIPWVEYFRPRIQSETLLVTVTLLIWISMQVVIIMNFPWVHPYDQVIN